MQQILDKVLKKIKPTAAETKKFQRITSQFLKKIKIKNTKAILGGSGEKDTWLSGAHDIDIFIQFDLKTYQDQDISNLLEENLKKAFKGVKRLHGSRDYFHIKFQSFLFEVVPILKISKSNQAINITDISPLHAQWVKKAPKKLRDDIRLAKQFTRANDCYGAESFIAGFSGYVIEILTIYYGSFENFLKAAVKWEIRDLVDVKKYYHARTEVFKQLNASKLLSPLIVIDPVDKTRNAAAALSIEKFLLFKQKAAKFIKGPHLKMFTKEKFTFKSLEKKTMHNLVYLEITPLAGKRDVVGSKLLKIFQFLEKELTPFKVKEANWDWTTFYFILEKRQIPPYIIRKGPPTKFEDAVKAFEKKNKDIFKEGTRLMAKIPLKNFMLKDFVKELLTRKYIKERMKSIKKVTFG